MQDLTPFLCASAIAASPLAIAIAGLLSVVSAVFFASDLKQLGNIFDDKKLSLDQYNDGVKTLATLEILGSLAGVFGDLGKISNVSSYAAQAYLIVWTSFIGIVLSSL